MNQNNELSYILNAPVPQKTESYTPIPHGKVITEIDTLLANNNFNVINKTYTANLNANIMVGRYNIEYGQDNELSMMLAFMNSYNKQVTFKTALGGQVVICQNGLCLGDLGAVKRKHTGSADTYVFEQLQAILEDADSTFESLIRAKEHMKNISLSLNAMSNMLGQLFVKENLLSPTEVNIVKQEIRKPSFDYGTQNSTLWDMFNHCTHSYKEAHPSLWLKKHIELSKWISDEFEIL